MTSDGGLHRDGALDPLVEVLVRSTFQLTGVLTRIGAEHDLSLTQLRLVGILRGRRARVGDLAAALGLDKSTLSGLIDRAERRGHVVRERSEHDRRVVEVLLAPAGRDLAALLEDEIRGALAPRLEGLEPERRAQLVALLEAVVGPAGPRDDDVADDAAGTVPPR